MRIGLPVAVFVATEVITTKAKVITGTDINTGS
jgi:hypothetical protein